MANDHVKMFIEEYSPIAEQVSKQTGIAPSLLLAQWGMESSYGRKPVGQFNLGNIKDMSGAGTEAVDNKTKSKDKYLNFESPEAFGDYYANLMRRLYPKALNAGSDISAYAEGLRNGVKGSYAEDENYEKVIRGAYQLTSGFYKDPEVPEVKVNPFEDYESESSKFRREQDERDRNKKTEVNPEDQQGGITAPDIGAGAGAIANLLFPPMTSPEKAVKIDTGKAQEANLTAQDKLDLARRNLRTAVPQGADNLEDAYRQSQSELERIKNEQALLESRLRGLPPSPTPPAPTPQEQLQIEARKITGAGAPYNTVQAMASERVPYNLAKQAIDMTRGEGHGKGAHDIIDIFNQAKEKAANLGGSDYVLTGEKGPGELYLPKEFAEPRNAEIEQRAEQTRQQQEFMAQMQEQERLLLQAELDRIRQERAAQGTRHNIVTGQTKEAAPLKRALTKAETDAEIARRKLARAQEQPNAAGRVLQNVGAGSAKMGALPRAVVGSGAGYIGVMSYQEALERFKAGDTSEGVLQALQAGSAAAAMLPPAGKGLTKARGAGVLGTLGLGGYQAGRRLLKERPPEE
jgi:hypothetical protein